MPITRITIYILSILAVIIASSTAGAVGMTSKRDCVVCHIMWLDSFRTDKETLIPFQPGNVLMKDSQGVVSSEEMCYSCHDGYVMDSRHITWDRNRHVTFVKPSENITVPPSLPLSVKGEIYCGTCHSAHGQGSAPHGDPTGKTSLMRETNVDSSLCEKCHSSKADYKRYNGHPVQKVASFELPHELFRKGSKEALGHDVVICQSCHRVHGAEGDKLLIVKNDKSQLCATCHTDKKNIIDTKHDLRITMPDERNVKKQLPSESGPCSACHTPHGAEGKKLWAKPLKPGNPASQMCLTCHGESAHTQLKGIGEYTHPVDVKPEIPENVPEELPLFTKNGEKNPDGAVQCFTCHDIHIWDPEMHNNKGGKDVEGNSLNSFLRISNVKSSLCLKCHNNKNQIITSDHNLEVTAPEEKNIQGFSAAEAGPCGSCHIPHNALSSSLWAKNHTDENDYVSQLCTSCHNKDGAAKDKLLGKNYHPVDVTLDKFNIQTTLPLYDSAGNKTVDGKMVCITCHDPHTWDPEKPVLNYSYTNMEGDASNSFLRKANFPSSNLCKNCHEDKAFVDGTDHDMNVTAPDSKNLLNQTVKESGQCGACHLVHNSPNQLKLWARAYGRVSDKEDVINELCNSCHSRGNIAENKIPRTAMHPEDKLVNNIMRCDRTKIDFAPIFDQDSGLETNVGNISCPTCHDAHRWSPLTEQKGENKNIEGNTTNSFLRNVSYNNICIDCHGIDALFRYKYFHDPNKRVESDSPVMNINN
jgi:predicted CXXCH cytochrome family protein